MKTKISYITVRSDFGGGPRHVDQLIDRLEGEYEIYVACPTGEPYGTKWRNDKKIHVVDIPYRKFSFKTLLHLKDFIKKENIQIVHSHGNGAGIYSRLIKLLCPSVKVAHTYHGISDTYKSKIKAVVSILVGRLLSPLADKYICVSNGEKRMALSRGFSKDQNTIVIYNGIEDPKSEARQKENKPVDIVCLSRFDYQKNMDAAFRIAFAFKDDDRACFTWVGDGQDKERLEQAAKEKGVRITFTGFSKKPSIYLQKADWYISTSRFEGLPYALIEAASVGLPILATDVKGNNEVVKDKYNGFLFHSEEEAIKLINDILDGKVNYSQLSQNSINFFHEYFTEDKMISNLRNLYNSLVPNDR